MSSPVEQIKQRLSILDVVGSYIKLQKAGKNFKAKSPFTNEKTPSFFVSPDRDMYYCFSSGKGGDIFTFVQEMEGLDFKGALRVLAERAGVELTSSVRENRDERDRLFALMEFAAKHYEEDLLNDKEALSYVTSRGVTQESLKRFRVGYAEPGWRNLHDLSMKNGFTIKELDQAGITKRGDMGKGHYDRFRGRIMFPICDSAGRVIAFSGRILPSKNNPEYKDDVSKYLNSPDTPLFSKSHALYGYDKAKFTIRKFDFSIVVEGQMDLLLSHQGGYPNTVAVSGSAMTDAQLTLLDRLSHNIVLAFDADQAGVASSGRTAELALSKGMNVKVAALPPGVDPADLVQKGSGEWKKVVRASKHIVDFYLDYLTETVRDMRTLRLEVGRRVLPYVALIPNKIDQAHFVSIIAARLGLPEEPVLSELAKTRVDVEVLREEPVRKEKVTKATAFDNLAERRLIGVFLWQRYVDGRDLNLEELEKELVEVFGEERLAALNELAETEKNQLLFEIESLYEDAHTLQNDVEEMLLNLKRHALVESRESVLAELRQAEASRDMKRVATLTETYASLTKELEALSLSE